MRFSAHSFFPGEQALRNLVKSSSRGASTTIHGTVAAMVLVGFVSLSRVDAGQVDSSQVMPGRLVLVGAITLGTAAAVHIYQARAWWQGQRSPFRFENDWDYAMNIDKIERELGWAPQESFESGIRKTIQWYLANQTWVEHVTSGSYREWINLQYNPNSPAGAAKQ